MGSLKKIMLVAASVAAIIVFGAADDCSSVTGDDGPPKGWSSVHPGDSAAQVEDKLGTPEDKQHFESGGEFGGGKSECWYYGSANSYQVCFDNAGTVESKNDY